MLSDVPGLSMVTDFVIDVMHTIDGGVLRDFAQRIAVLQETSYAQNSLLPPRLRRMMRTKSERNAFEDMNTTLECKFSETIFRHCEDSEDASHII